MWGCNKEPWFWHLNFIHPQIVIKDFEEDLDFFDDEEKEYTFDTY